MATTKNQSTSGQFVDALQEIVVQEPPKHVTAIQSGCIQTSEAGKAPVSYADDIELAHLVSEFIVQGYAFVDAPAGWPPAEVLKLLQKRGLIAQDFIAIAWRAPGMYRTYLISCNGT